MKLSKLKSLFALALMTSLIVTGCSSTSVSVETTESATNDVSTEITQFPIRIQHAFGETVIDQKPERVAAIAWGNYDVPLALGVIPVGISMANYGVTDNSGMLPWTLDKFSALGVEDPVLFDDLAGLNFEAIADSNPDVILAAYSGITKEEYDLLSEIAPVVAYPQNPWQTLWRDQITLNATAMGMKSEGEALVNDLEILIDEKVANYDELKNLKAAFFYFNPADLGSFYMYLPNDPRAAYLTDLGMAFPESVMTLNEDASSFAISISSEKADLLDDIDLIITYGNDDLLEALKSDRLLGTIPAIQNGAVAVIEDGTPLAASGTPSALSISATLDDYLKILAEAASNVK